MNDLTKFDVFIMALLGAVIIWLALLQGSVNGFRYLFEVIEKEQNGAIQAIQTAKQDAVKAIQTSIDLDKYNTELKTLLTTTETQLDTLQQKGSQTQQQLEGMTQEIEQKLMSLVETISNTRQELDGLIERKTTILADIQTDSLLLEKKEQLDTLIQSMTEIKEGVFELNQQKETILTNIQAIQDHELATAEQRFEMFQQQITQAQQALAQMAAQKEKLLSGTQMEDKLAQAESHFNAISGQITSGQQELEQLESRKATLFEETQQADQLLVEAENKLTLLQQNTATARQEFNDLVVAKAAMLLEVHNMLMVISDKSGLAQERLNAIITKTWEEKLAIPKTEQKVEPEVPAPEAKSPEIAEKPVTKIEPKAEASVVKPIPKTESEPVAKASPEKPVDNAEPKPVDASPEKPVAKVGPKSVGDAAVDVSNPEQKADESITKETVVAEEVVTQPSVEQVIKEDGKTFSDRLKDGSLGPDMLWMPMGSFQMGDIQKAGSSDEQPVQAVSIKKPFAIGVYEVTFAQYDQFAEATGRAKPSDEGWGRDNRPVINISWNDAMAYAKWLSEQTGQSYRLPTEAEWEYAARAGTETQYWWGNSMRLNKANCKKDCADAFDFTAPVGSFVPNPFGLYDVIGNVWEWTCSTYEPVYAGQQHLCASDEKNNLRALRGGAWFLNYKNVRIANRYRLPSTKSHTGVGFRLVRD